MQQKKDNMQWGKDDMQWRWSNTEKTEPLCRLDVKSKNGENNGDSSEKEKRGRKKHMQLRKTWSWNRVKGWKADAMGTTREKQEKLTREATFRSYIYSDKKIKTK